MSETTTNSGIGFTGLLTIVFIVFKLLGKITWSWWWVLSPLWISFSIGMGIFLIAITIFLICEARDSHKRRRWYVRKR